ncbi:hypothetical protein D3C78_1870200 [compost metagenome]
MRYRDLAAVGKAGFLRGGALAVDDGDLVPGAGQIPGTGDADHAGTEDDDLHARSGV